MIEKALLQMPDVWLRVLMHQLLTSFYLQTKKDQEYLASLNIFSCDDPFKVTNQLILLIEELVEKKHKE